MKLLDGRVLATKHRATVRDAIRKAGITPGLASILVGDDQASQLYLKLKAQACTEVGVLFERYDFPETVAPSTLLDTIATLNHRKNISGILLQLPLPQPLEPSVFIHALSPEKDVDGFHPHNLAALAAGHEERLPVLIRTVLALLGEAGTPLKGKSMMVLGKSDVFLAPFVPVFSRRDVHVITSNIIDPRMVRASDIVVTALGQPKVLHGSMVKPHAILIDIGTTPTADGVVGDVDAASVADQADWLTPVPGGVGPVTIAMLLENTARAAGISFPHTT